MRLNQNDQRTKIYVEQDHHLPKDQLKFWFMRNIEIRKGIVKYCTGIHSRSLNSSVPQEVLFGLHFDQGKSKEAL